MSDLAFKVNNLNLYYGEKQALFNVNMEIEERAITALIGPSGCGKSTFLRVLNRMNDLIEGCRITGEVLYRGQNVFDVHDVNQLRRQIGMVFQKPNPFPMSIYDNITFALKSMGIKKKSILDETVERSLKQASIWDEVSDRLHESALALSGGQQQRICIARAIAVDPEVILMDEPTSALDPISTLKIENLIEELKQQYTIVLVTHNMQQAARCSDSTAFFLLGEVIEKDATNVIFTNPKEQRTEDYVTGRFG